MKEESSQNKTTYNFFHCRNTYKHNNGRFKRNYAIWTEPKNINNNTIWLNKSRQAKIWCRQNKNKKRRQMKKGYLA